MSDQPFLRQVELLIGPLSEWRGGGNQDQALRIYSDGTQDHLRVKFSIHKHLISTATPTVISVYNLSAGLRAALRKSEAQIVLNIGWENRGLTQVFVGSLLAAVHERQGGDIVTNLISLAGFGGISRSVYSITYNNQTQISTIVKDFASQIPGIKIDPKLINIKGTTVRAQGWSFAGHTSEGLDRLARMFGFSWWINNGYFNALSDNKALQGGRVLISSKNGSLLKAEPMLASPMQKQAGTTIQSILNPDIEPGKLIQLESEVNPKLNGEYKVHTLSHSGDTFGNDWRSSIESWIQVI